MLFSILFLKNEKDRLYALKFARLFSSKVIFWGVIKTNIRWYSNILRKSKSGLIFIDKFSDGSDNYK